MHDIGSAARTTVAVTMTQHHDRHFSPSLFSPANIDDYHHTQGEKGSHGFTHAVSVCSCEQAIASCTSSKRRGL